MAASRPALERALAPQYRLLQELPGSHGAEVFLAEDTRHGRQVVIKVLHPDHASGFAAERVLREAELSARLQHPHIVPLLDSGEAAGHLYLVMPRVEGHSLRETLARRGRLTPAEVIRILIDVADALAYAHGKGVVHGDITPDNILLVGRHAVVTDLGVARAVSAAGGSMNLTGGAPIGTPAYMAPEQVNAAPDADHRVDLYALGVTGYELLSGEVPFTGPTAQAVLAAHLLDDPMPIEERCPGLPAGLAPILMRLLAKEPGERWQTATELMDALEPLDPGSGDTTPPGVVPARHSHRGWMALAAVAGLVLLWWSVRRTAPPLASPVQRPVTFSGMVTSSAISPDGRSVAFAVESAGVAHLVVQEVGGGTARTIATSDHFDQVSWAGDGSTVRAFSIANHRGVLHVIPRLGGGEQTWFAAGWSSPSPDGSKIATSAPGTSAPGRIPFFIRTLATSDTVRVPADTGTWQSPPAWSPDGRRIAWAAEDVRTRRTRMLVIEVARPQPVVAYQDSISLGTPVWDGNDAILFLRNAGPTADLLRLAIGADQRAAGAPSVMLTGLMAGSSQAFTAFYRPVSVAASGAILYTRSQSWSNIEVSTFEAAARGEPPRRLSDGYGDYLVARFSSDGRALALVRNIITGMVLEVLPLDGSGRREVGQMAPWRGLSWSPSGNQIAVVLEDPDSGVGLRVFQVDQPRARSYLYGRVGESPDWVDDSTVLVTGPGSHGLLRVRLPLGTATLLPGVDTSDQMVWPRADPVGRQLAVVWDRGALPRSSLYRYTFADSTMRELLRGGVYVPVRWSSDGRVLFVVAGNYFADTTRVFALPAEGGPLRPLGRFPPDVIVQDVSPDGQRAVLIRRETRADAWLIDRLP